MYQDEMFLITLIARDCVFSRLTGDGEEERKRHALALEKLQRARMNGINGRSRKQKIKEEPIDTLRLKMY